MSYSVAGNNAFKAAASLAASIDTCNAASLVRMVARDASAASLSAGIVALMSSGAKAAFRAALRASCAMTLAFVMSTVIMFYAPLTIASRASALAVSISVGIASPVSLLRITYQSVDAK